MSPSDQEPGSGLPSDSDGDGSTVRPAGRPRWARWSGEASGAFSDLGTFLPLMLGVYTVSRLDPTGMLIGFGPLLFGQASYQHLTGGGERDRRLEARIGLRKGVLDQLPRPGIRRLR